MGMGNGDYRGISNEPPPGYWADTIEDEEDEKDEEDEEDEERDVPADPNWRDASLQIDEVAALIHRLDADMRLRPGAYLHTERSLIRLLSTYSASLPIIAETIRQRLAGE